MKDFDEARKAREEADRSFRIGGENFVYRAAVAPESLLAWSEFSSVGDKEAADLNAARAALAAVRAQRPADLADDATDEAKLQYASDMQRHEQKVAEFTERVAEKQAKLTEVTKSEHEWLEIIDETVMTAIEPEYHDAWRKVRNVDMAHPINLADLQELLQWLMEQVTSRPTGEPSGSSPSPVTTGTSSTDGSSSQEVVAPTA